MCGITGVWQPGGLTEDALQLLQRMTDALRHRGPDDGGLWCDQAAGVGLGHRRLSILDLSPEGHQPMASADGRWMLAYNGEIYNFIDLRRELEGQGVRFRGGSDTEVLLELIARQGIRAALQKSAGMFAIAVWDKSRHELHLARDRMGEKPIYFAERDGSLAFASELGSLRMHSLAGGGLDRLALAQYLQLGYIPAPYSVYQGVRKLPPATLATFGRGMAPRFERFWNLPSGEMLDGITDGDAMAMFTEQLSATVKQQMVADVPLGAMLSGGLDSSLIVSLMQELASRPVRTFTIGFAEASFNEAAHARTVANHLGTEHTELYLPGDAAMQMLPSLPAVFGEPFADPSALPTLLVAKLARRGVTVALSGDGGDELFLGYNWHAKAMSVWDRLEPWPSPLRASAAAGFEFAGASMKALGSSLRWRERTWRAADLMRASSVVDVHGVLVRHTARPERVGPKSVVRRPVQSPPDTNAMRALSRADIDQYLPDDILVKTDRSSMAYGLEGRAPFLDHRVVELAWRLPARSKERGGERKWLLRRMLEQRVPREIVDRPKQGFSVPIAQWLRGPLRAWASDLLAATRLSQHGLVDVQDVRRRWEEHLTGARDWQYALWPVLMFEAWLDAQPLGLR